MRRQTLDARTQNYWPTMRTDLNQLATALQFHGRRLAVIRGRDQLEAGLPAG